MKQAIAEIKNHVECRHAQEKEIRQLKEEREKFKKRIAKLNARKGNFSTGIKTCRKCTHEYLEKENFNWSCRTH